MVGMENTIALWKTDSFKVKHLLNDPAIALLRAHININFAQRCL